MRTYLPLLTATAVLTACGSTTDPGRGSSGADLPVALLSSPDTNAAHSTIVLVSADGRATRTLATFVGPKGQIRWSPDGRRLAFVGARSADAYAYTLPVAVWTINADGTGLQQLPGTAVSMLGLNWLADGRLVYRVFPSPAAGGGAYAGWVAVPPTGGAAVPLSVGTAQQVLLPVFQTDVSRDGAHIAFRGDHVYTARLDGSNVHALGQGGWPRWSPLADRVAYLADTATVVLARADGTGTPVTFALGGRVGIPRFAWSTDESRVAWLRAAPNASPPGSRPLRAVTAPADGSGPAMPLVIRAATATDVDLDVDWRPPAAP